MLPTAKQSQTEESRARKTEEREEQRNGHLGDGGAVVVIPLMFAMGAPALLAIGLSQAIQFVIAATATIGNLSVGHVDFTVGGILGAALVSGILLGTRIAHALPIEVLRKTVAWVLVLVGLSITLQLAREVIGV